MFSNKIRVIVPIVVHPCEVLPLSRRSRCSLDTQLAQQLVDHPERGVNVVRVDDQRRRETQRTLAGAEQQKTSTERALHQLVHELGRRLPRCAILHELHTDHEADATHIADRFVTLGKPAQTGHETLAHP